MHKLFVATVVFIGVVALAALGIGVLALLQAWKNQPLNTQPQGEAIEITTIAGIEPAATDTVLTLEGLDEGGNTQVLWSCGKVLAGERHDYAGAWGHLQGGVLVDPQTETLKAVELHISVGSMRGHGQNPAPTQLINTTWIATSLRSSQ